MAKYSFEFKKKVVVAYTMVKVDIDILLKFMEFQLSPSLKDGFIIIKDSEIMDLGVLVKKQIYSFEKKAFCCRVIPNK